MKYILGLGNPGEEYENTRHNAGRIILDIVRKTFDGGDWERSKVHEALVSEVKIGKQNVMLLMPETFMNKSGASLRKLVTSKKKAEDLLVIYDDLDIPIGKMKISHNKSSGGHKGLESIIRQVKTLEFARIRVGVSGETAGGKLKKPLGDEKVAKHILGKFKEDEVKTLKKLGKKIAIAIDVWANEGWEKSASLYSNLEV